MYEINLCCPECGAYHFDAEENNRFSCPECGWIGTTDEMELQIFEE